MLRLLAPTLVALLVTACGDAPPAPASGTPSAPAPGTPSAPAPGTPPAPLANSAPPTPLANSAPPTPAADTPGAADAPDAAPSPAASPAPIVPGADDPRCGPAYVYLNAIRPDADLTALQGAYRGTALQFLIKQSDVATARQDDLEILAALASADPLAVITARYAIHDALAQWMRQSLKLAAESADRSERDAAWTAARCAWARHLRDLGLPLLERNTLVTDLTANDPNILELVDAAFTAGTTALTAVPVDDRTLLPARQTIEKGWYRLVHRELAYQLADARERRDPAALARARGLFEALRDRMADKNSPGVAIITAALAGPPDRIDPAALMRQLDIALVKRARKYCSEALDPKLAGTAAGLASVAEGAAYTRILTPGMRALPGFDAIAHMAAWQGFYEAVGIGESPDELRRISDELVHWNCAYQQALGVRECTANADEKPAP